MERHLQLTNGQVSEKKHYLLLKDKRDSPDFWVIHLSLPMNNVKKGKFGNCANYGLIWRIWNYNWNFRHTREEGSKAVYPLPIQLGSWLKMYEQTPPSL